MQKKKLGLDEEGAVEIIDLRIKPEDVEALLDGKKYFPGYHMNKKHWITVVPGEDISVDLLAELIDDSWNLIVDKLSKKEQQRLRPR